MFRNFPRETNPNRPWQARQTEGLTVRKEKVSLVLMNWRTSKGCQTNSSVKEDLVGFSWGKINPQIHGMYRSYEIYLYVNCKYIYISIYIWGKSTKYIYTACISMSCRWPGSRVDQPSRLVWIFDDPCQGFTTWTSWVYTQKFWTFWDLLLANNTRIEIWTYPKNHWTLQKRGV